jgi:hypothetical protein
VAKGWRTTNVSIPNNFKILVQTTNSNYLQQLKHIRLWPSHAQGEVENLTREDWTTNDKLNNRLNGLKQAIFHGYRRSYNNTIKYRVLVFVLDGSTDIKLTLKVIGHELAQDAADGFTRPLLFMCTPEVVDKVRDHIPKVLRKAKYNNSWCVQSVDLKETTAYSLNDSIEWMSQFANNTQTVQST